MQAANPLREDDTILHPLDDEVHLPCLVGLTPPSETADERIVPQHRTPPTRPVAEITVPRPVLLLLVISRLEGLVQVAEMTRLLRGDIDLRPVVEMVRPVVEMMIRPVAGTVTMVRR
jgi:hypothetical protein